MALLNKKTNRLQTLGKRDGWKRHRRWSALYATVSLSSADSVELGLLHRDQALARKVEVEAILALLKKGDLPGDRATSEGGKPSESVRDVRDLLLSSVRPGANYRQFSLALDGLERVLAAQLVVIGASPNSDAEEPPPAQAVPVEEMNALN